MKNILIVGSKGYIGSQLYDILLNEKKLNIFGIDNLLYGKTWLKKNVQANFKKMDCRDISFNFLKKFDYVIFLAGLSNNPIDDLFPEKAYKIVEKYTIDFAKKCKRAGIKFIFPSSCSVYGFGTNIFFENSKVNPLTYYSKNKINIEKKLLKLSDKNFNPLILRLATVYGFSKSIRLDLVINMFIGMALKEKKIMLNSDGQAIRPHVNIEYVCKVIKFFLFNYPKKAKVINVGENHNNIKILKIAKIVGEQINVKKISFTKKNSIFKESLFNKKDPRSYNVNFKKLKSIIKKNIKKSDIKKEISKIAVNLRKSIKYNKNILFNENFYRLQKIKKNLKTGYCNNSLIVKTK